MSRASANFKIGKNFISHESPTYFIADIAANHDGDLSRAVDLIRLAASAGADAAKFQHFKAETIVSDYGFKSLGGQKSHQSEWEKSVFDVYKDASVDLGWTPKLKEVCDEVGIDFFTSPYHPDLVDHIDPFVPAYKIGSGDITWHEIIRYIAKKNKPYILATGASTMDEVVKAVEVGLEINSNLCVMQCNTNYTASLENFKYIQLNVLKCYREMFPGMILGLSDHTPGHSTVLGAVTLGARMIEKHFTDDNARVGPDHRFSLNPESWSEMVERTRELELALGNGIKKVEGNERETVVLQRRSVRIKRDLKEGEIVRNEDLEVLRPCPIGAIEPWELASLDGLTLSTNKFSGEALFWQDFSVDKN